MSPTKKRRSGLSGLDVLFIVLWVLLILGIAAFVWFAFLELAPGK